MTQSQVPTFPSPTSIQAWAGNNSGKRLDDAWYVQKDDTYYYFGHYTEGWKLVMESSHDIAEGEN